MAKKNNSKRNKRVFITFVVLWVVGLLAWYLHAKNFEVLNPAGMVAVKQRNLFIFTVLLSLVVLIPVYIMTFLFAYRYREGNEKATYSPDMSGNKLFEALWWGIPAAIILTLSVVTWQTSHSLDPRRPLDVTGKPMTVQVVALQWKWLFIYPEQNVASVNYLKLPVGTPVNFHITSDAPMNSFWIPQLGSQIYAMTGMNTQLHLMADKAGDYRGSSANLSGAGFSDMDFTASAAPMEDFNTWVAITKTSPNQLDKAAYAALEKPDVPKEPVQYSSVEPGLFNSVMLKYMGPQ